MKHWWTKLFLFFALALSLFLYVSPVMAAEETICKWDTNKSVCEVFQETCTSVGKLANTAGCNNIHDPKLCIGSTSRETSGHVLIIGCLEPAKAENICNPIDYDKNDPLYGFPSSSCTSPDYCSEVKCVNGYCAPPICYPRLDRAVAPTCPGTATGSITVAIAACNYNKCCVKGAVNIHSEQCDMQSSAPDSNVWLRANPDKNLCDYYMTFARFTPVERNICAPDPRLSRYYDPNTHSCKVAAKSDIFLCFTGADCRTALGIIGNSPQDLLKFLLRLAFSLAGLVIIYTILTIGYRVLTSQGNPEKLQSARELATSLIGGVLLLIFSLVILRAIGFDILQLPGFG